MTKELIIIALVILVIYLSYRQTQPNTLFVQLEGADEQLQELRKQVQRYQSLYQKRVAKDLEQQEYSGRLNQKITDLETSLLNLAKQKIKGKKDAEQLVQQLESNWQQDKKQAELNYNLVQTELTHLTQQLNLSQDKNQELTEELETKKNWGQSKIPELKQELFASAQATLTELSETVEKAYFVKGKSEVKGQLAQLGKFFELESKKPSTWTTNRLTELEQNLRQKEAKIKDLERQLGKFQKK